jgi:predicted nucleic acid-binding protein
VKCLSPKIAKTAADGLCRHQRADQALYRRSQQRRIQCLFHGPYALVDQVAPHPLRTLDALHLSAAIRINANEFATADRNQAEAAKALFLTVFIFIQSKS